MHRSRAASLGLVSRIVTLALVATGLLSLPGSTGTALAAIPSPAAPLTGHIDEFPVTAAAADPLAITAGPDGNLWFADGNTTVGRIGRVSLTGTVSTFPVPTAAGLPMDIVAGPNGNLWFSENAAPGAVGEITTGVTPTVTETALLTAG